MWLVIFEVSVVLLRWCWLLLTISTGIQPLSETSKERAAHREMINAMGTR